MLQPTPAKRRESAAQSPAPMAPQERRVLSETELAQRWGVSPKTLQRWRSEGRGPNYLKLSKRVTYPIELVTEYERSAVYLGIGEPKAR